MMSILECLAVAEEAGELTGVAKPSQVRHPARMAVSGDEDVVADLVLRQVVERPVAV